MALSEITSRSKQNTLFVNFRKSEDGRMLVIEISASNPITDEEAAEMAFEVHRHFIEEHYGRLPGYKEHML